MRAALICFIITYKKSLAPLGTRDRSLYLAENTPIFYDANRHAETHHILPAQICDIPSFKKIPTSRYF
ncbi:hypothetical protein DJ568_10565 [Mucilaginibacter hurinus]|uniref:Uncharacterized protein n=1 Tax=Mucilaginibacter hurinus TaxID=2201324 RepID=A0A367GQF5_9SPHI|nr:hypothetical protein DJ568_10565 [Mucilaginibacter hurinus]